MDACEDLEMEIEKGWAFNTADFSTVAAERPNATGGVTLIRDRENYNKWMGKYAGDANGEEPELYVVGRGKTFEEAITNANLAAAHAKPL
jgi:hypothetical protein